MDRLALSAEPLDISMHKRAMSEPDGEHDTNLDECSTSSSPTTVAHLPENVVRLVALHSLQSGGRQNSILALLAMCGVCKHWRKAASSVHGSLLFDGTAQRNAATTTYEQKFRTLPQSERQRVLLAAAKLLRGTRSSSTCKTMVSDGLRV